MPRVRLKPGHEAIVTQQPGKRARVKFVPVSSATLLELADERADVTVAGAYVKVAPTIRASEREAFDATRVVESLRGRGARAVLVAPTVVADARVETKRAEKVVSASSARDATRAWFEQLAGLSDEDRAACIELAERYIEEEEQ